jgi:hypothetical protein
MIQVNDHQAQQSGSTTSVQTSLLVRRGVSSGPDEYSTDIYPNALMPNDMSSHRITAPLKKTGKLSGEQERP